MAHNDSILQAELFAASCVTDAAVLIQQAILALRAITPDCPEVQPSDWLERRDDLRTLSPMLELLQNVAGGCYDRAAQASRAADSLWPE